MTSLKERWWESDCLQKMLATVQLEYCKASGKSLGPNKVKASMYEQSFSLAFEKTISAIVRPHKSACCFVHCKPV